MFVVNQSPVSIMGVVNITPDSFSDGGKYLDSTAAIKQAERLISEGANIIDLGAQSTRPGAVHVGCQEELQRLLPVIRAIRDIPNIQISIDTYQPEVMQVVLDEGINMINDVFAFTKPNALAVVAPYPVKLCFMHMQGTPQTIQYAPTYTKKDAPSYPNGVIKEVMAFFQARIQAANACGIDASRIIIDPGFAFGKSVGQSLALIKHLDKFVELNTEILVGVSRKSPIGEILDKPPKDRLIGSIVLAHMAVQKGANYLRVHDVQETLEMLKISHAMDAVIDE